MEKPAVLTPQQMSVACLCLNTQRAARAVARRYDAALRPVGITSGQFAILAGLDQQDPVSIGALADQLGLERTTLTRNVVPLERAGLVRSAAEDGDRRVRRLELAPLGRQKVATAMPYWREAQDATSASLAPMDWSTIQPVLARLGDS